MVNKRVLLEALRHRKLKILTRPSIKVAKALDSVVKAQARTLAVMNQQHLVMEGEELVRMAAANAEEAKRTIIITIMVTTKTIRDSFRESKVEMVLVEDQARCLNNKMLQLKARNLSKSSIHNRLDNSNNICLQGLDLIITHNNSLTTMTSSNLLMIELVSRTGKMMALGTIKHQLDAAVEITVATSQEVAVEAVHKEMAAAAWATNNFKHLSHFHNTRQVEREALVVIMVVVVEDVAAKVITTTTMTDMT